MKKFFCLIILILLFTTDSSSVYADVLEGGVKYDVAAARAYLKDGQVDSISVTGPFEIQEDNIERIVRSYNNSGELIGTTVQYIKDSKRAYIYGRNNRLIYMEKYDKPTNIYPHRGYRYDLNGNLNLSSLSVSKTEHFRFSPDGKLIAHDVNGITYDENNNVIGKAK